MTTFEPGLYAVTKSYTGDWFKEGQIIILLKTVLQNALYQYALVKIISCGNGTYMEDEAAFRPDELERIA